MVSGIRYKWCSNHYLGCELWRASGHIDTTSDADAAAPIGCAKTDIHEDGKCTSAVTARESTRQKPSSRASWTSQAVSDSDAHRGRYHISGYARSGRKRSIRERLGQKGGEVTHERMSAISAWRTSGRVATIDASTIALNEMWTYLGDRKERWKSATAAGG